MPRAARLEVSHLTHQNHQKFTLNTPKKSHGFPRTTPQPALPFQICLDQRVYIHRPHIIDCSAGSAALHLDPARPSGVQQKTKHQLDVRSVDRDKSAARHSNRSIQKHRVL